MPNLEQLYEELVRLPRRDYSELINRVDTTRRQAVEQEDSRISSFSRDEFARWVGRRHFGIDKGITKVLHLPDKAPDDEVRLLEVNSLAPIPENAPIAALDFQPDIEGVKFKLFVADVTPGQFERIQRDELPLPEGWSRTNWQEVSPSAP